MSRRSLCLWIVWSLPCFDPWISTAFLSCAAYSVLRFAAFIFTYTYVAKVEIWQPLR
jgi:hypothetical protein